MIATDTRTRAVIAKAHAQKVADPRRLVARKSETNSCRDRSLKSSVRNDQLKRCSRHRYLFPGYREPIGDRDGRSRYGWPLYDECEYRRRQLSDIVDRLALHPFRAPPPPRLFSVPYRSLSPRNA